MDSFKQLVLGKHRFQANQFSVLHELVHPLGEQLLHGHAYNLHKIYFFRPLSLFLLAEVPLSF